MTGMPYRRRPASRSSASTGFNSPVVSTRVIDVDGLEVKLTRKRIRNMYLRVKPPTGDVEVSAPARMAERRIVDFVRERRSWIERQRERMADSLDLFSASGLAPFGDDGATQGSDSGGFPGSGGSDGPFAGGSSGTSGGTDAPASSIFDRTQVWTDERREQAADAINAALPGLLAKWTPIVGKSPTHITLRLMTSRWGSCTPKTGRIRLNLQLGLMEPEFLEYVLVHELTHLWEHGHGDRFRARMDMYLPRWRELRRELNRRVVL